MSLLDLAAAGPAEEDRPGVRAVINDADLLASSGFSPRVIGMPGE